MYKPLYDISGGLFKGRSRGIGAVSAVLRLRDGGAAKARCMGCGRRRELLSPGRCEERFGIDMAEDDLLRRRYEEDLSV
jgi:hypothetical protein